MAKQEEELVPVTAKVPKDIKEKAHAKADKQDRTLSAVIRRFLRRWVAEGDEQEEG